MIEALLFIGCFFYFGLLGALSGNSLPPPFRITKKWMGQIPEIVFALSVAGIAVWFRNLQGTLPLSVNVYDFITFAIFVYAGKQAATWAMLSNNFKNGYQKDTNNDGVVDYNDGRKSKIKNIVDDIAEALNVPITSPKYAWVWATVKGFLMTWPFAGTGAIAHTFGHWLAVKLFDSRPYSNAYKEWIGVGLCVATAVTIAYAYFKYWT